MVDASIPGARSWERLAASLVAAGPLLSLRIRHGQPVDGADGGHVRFGDDGAGRVWAEVTLDPAVRGMRAEQMLAHELGHVADELTRLSSMTAAAWLDTFRDPHLSDAAEAFAVSCESWVRPSTPAEEILAAARRHHGGRRG
ncbi:hypothetical protein [Streptomyces nigra]